MKELTRKIYEIIQRSAWKHLFIRVVVAGFSAWNTIVDFWLYANMNFLKFRHGFAKRTAQRAHYIGADIQRPHKLTAALLLGVLVGGVVAAPTVEDMMIWALIWGTIFSVIVTFKAIKRWLEIMSFIGPGRKKAI